MTALGRLAEIEPAPMAERFFNTSGPVVPAKHYSIPPLGRLDLDELLRLIRDERYFVLHAPRQTGKTSALLALRDLLNGRGTERSVYVNVETGQTARGDVAQGMRAVLASLSMRARALGDGFLAETWQRALADMGPHAALTEVLNLWCLNDPMPLVLLIDEIDTLVGDTLISVLRQLRAGYDMRPAAFPQSVILCGVRDVRDYPIRSASGDIVTGGSAFNIKAKSLRLGDFDEADMRALLGQHTTETGQRFTEDALTAVWNQTQGQPWLVNALAQQACFEDEASRDRTRPIDGEDVMAAREELVLGRQTHLHQLADKLGEERVRRVVEPVLSGGGRSGAASPDDVEYVRDLGLLARSGTARIANPIYREVIPRELMYAREAEIAHETEWYVKPDGDLDMDGLLAGFQRFFREHSEHWIERFQYKEAGPQLLLQAFLHRIVNGGGRIEREYALGRRRTDLLIVWPPGGAADTGTPARRHVVECKVLRGGLEATIREGIGQTLDYVDRCRAESGHLVIFDRDESKPWEEKLYRRDESEGGRPVTVWGA